MLYHLFTTLLEEAVLITVALFVLPRFGITIPLWLLFVLVASWAVYSYIGFRFGVKVIGKTPMVGPEALAGARGVTTTPLTPEGYVRVGAELWRARSTAGHIGENVEVTIIDMKGLTLLVTGSTGSREQNEGQRINGRP